MKPTPWFFGEEAPELRKDIDYRPVLNYPEDYYGIIIDAMRNSKHNSSPADVMCGLSVALSQVYLTLYDPKKAPLDEAKRDFLEAISKSFDIAHDQLKKVGKL